MIVVIREILCLENKVFTIGPMPATAVSDTNLSERKLMDCLNRLGYDIEIKVKPAAEPVGHLTLALLAERVKG